MKQKRRTERLLALALLPVFVLGLAWVFQITSVSVAGTEPEATPKVPSPSRFLGIVGSPGVSSVATQSCSSGNHPAVEHCYLNGVDVIKVNLNDSSITIRPVIAPNGGLASLSSLAGAEGIAAINGDYRLGSCNNGVNCGEGLTYVDGNNYTMGPPDTYNYRRSLAFNQSLDPHIGRPSEQGGYLWHVIGGGPRFTENGNFHWVCGDGSQNQDCPNQGGTVVINDEYFGSSATNWWNRPQSAIGFSSDGNTIYLAASAGNVTMQTLHDVLWQMGSRNNLKLDGGSARSLYYNDGPGHYLYLGQGIAEPNAWVILPSSGPTPTPPPSAAWHAEYFDNQDCWWDPNCTRSPRSTEDFDGFIAKDWGSGSPPDIPGDNWSARFRGTLNFSSGDYVFHSDHDDGVKIFLDGSNIMDVGGAGNDYACPAQHLSGDHQLQVNFREDGGDARLYVDWSTDQSPCITPPDRPTLVSPANGARLPQSTDLTLTWNPSARANEYAAEHWGGPGGLINSGHQPGTSWHIGQQLVSSYSWHVEAYNDAGWSGWSDPWTFTIVPNTPTDLSVSAVSSSQIDLSWSDPGGEKDGYKVYRNGSHVGTTESTTYQDMGLNCNTTYSYYVKAYKGSYESDPSNTGSDTTWPCPPQLDSPVNGADVAYCRVMLDWHSSDGANEYYAEFWGVDTGFCDWRSSTSCDLPPLTPGSYSWHVKARDDPGEESDWSDTWHFTADPNQPPNAPSLVSPDDGVWTNSRTVTLQWQDNGDPDNCPRDYRTYNVEISRSGWSNSISNHSGTSWQVTVPSDADYQWHVQAYDGDLTSGWSGYRTVKVDATPPDTSITNGPSGVIPTGSATFTWTGSDNRTSTGDLKYSYRLVGLSNDWSSWSTATSVTYNDLTDGDYTFEVKARDFAHNEDPSPATRSFGVDVTPPETTITGGPSGYIGTADVTFTWTGSDNRTSTAELLYSYKLEGFDADWSAWTSATSKSYTGLSDGDYTFKVKAKDGVGHEDPSPAAQSFRVDTTPPTGSVLINGGDSTTNKITVHLDIVGDDGPVGCGLTEMRLSNDGFNWEAWQPFATEGEWLLPTLNRTTWTVHLQLKDLVGNVSGAFTDDIYLDLYPPRPSSDNYQLGARVMASGDPTSSSESYGLLSATMGQPIADGRMQGTAYRLESGYQGAWPSVPRGRLPPESYDINASLVASSGEYQTSESYRLQSATGQSTDVGPRSSENYQLLSGYLPCKLFGDLNVNGRVDVTDIMLVASKWRCRLGDDCYHKRFDLDKDDDIDVVDIMLVVVHWGETCG